MTLRRFCSARSLALAAAIAVAGSLAHAQVPRVFTYQGTLADSGVPVNGPASVTLRFFEASAGGPALATYGPTVVAVTGGLFTFEAADAGLLGVVTGRTELWLEVEADGSVFPRQRVTSALYAIHAGLAEDSSLLGGFPPAESFSAQQQVYVSRADGFLPADVVDSQSIAAGAVTGQKIGDDAIETQHLFPGAVDSFALGDLAVTTQKIDNGAVTGQKIGDDAVETQHLFPGAVDSFALGDLAVTTQKIDNGAVTGQKIGDDAVETQHLFPGAVDSFALGDLAVTTQKIDGGAVTGQKIGDDAVETQHLFPGAVDSFALGDLAVTTQKIDGGAVTGAKIADDAIESHHILSGAVGSDALADGGVGADDVAADTAILAKISDSQIAALPNVVEIASTSTLQVLGDTEVLGFAGFGAPNTSGGTVRVQVDGTLECTTLVETSSGRYKDDVRDISGALATLDGLRGVTFTWNRGDRTGQRDYGFIAEEVAAVVPELVLMEADGANARGMDYTHLVPLAVEGIQELKVENDALRAENAALARTLAAMEARLAALEASTAGGRE